MSDSLPTHGQAAERAAPPADGTRKRRTGGVTDSHLTTTAQAEPENSAVQPSLFGCSDSSLDISATISQVSNASRSIETSASRTIAGESAPEESSIAKPKRKRPRSKLEKFQEIMDLMGSKNRFTLGEFFELLLDPKTRLTDSERGMLSSWLKGSTNLGLRPVETVVAMYQHPLAIEFHQGKIKHSDFSELAPQSRKPLYLDKYPHDAELLPPPSSSSQHFSAREGLEELFARSTLAIVDLEAEKLCLPDSGLSRGAKPTWDMFSEFNLAKEHSTVKKHAPVSWSIASTIAWNRKRSWKPSADMAEQPDDELDASESDHPSVMLPSTGFSDRARNPVLAILIIFFILLIFRNQKINMFQHIVGVFLFACNSPKQVYQVLGRVGIASAHSTVHTILAALADSAIEILVHMGISASESALDSNRAQEFFLLLFDNINKHHRAWKQTIAKVTQMKSGTAATAIGVEDAEPGAFDPKGYFTNLDKQERRSLTVERLFQDIDGPHLRKVGVGMIMRIFATHIPNLKGLSGDVETWFVQNCTRRKLRLRKSKIQPMGTSGIDESTASGGSNVLHDLILQMKLNANHMKNFLVMVCGDWLSVDRLRKAIRYKAKDSNIYEQRRWALPIVQLWHMKWAFLKVIFKTHWPEATGPDTFINLRHGFEATGRRFNPNKCDFYPGNEGLKTVFDTLILTSALEVLADPTSKDSNTGPDDQHSHMLSDLRAHFGPGGKLENCTCSQLEALAGSIYDRFMTTEAYLEATTVKDWDIDSERLTKAMANMLATLGQRKRKPKPQPAGTEPQVELDLQADTAAEQDTAMDIDNYHQDGGESASDRSSASSAAEDVQPVSDIPTNKLGDSALGNAILLMRDAFWYLEFATAVTEGDIGRVFEIIKVLRFSFWGGGATNYGNELLEIACNYFYEYPTKLQDAILNNYLVNPSGLPNHWHELDLLQEHHNLWIKRVFNKKNSDFDSSFLRKAVSVNIQGLSQLRNSVFRMLGLSAVPTGRSLPAYEHDINVLATHYRRNGLFSFKAGRSQSFNALDTFSHGYEKLQSGALAKFLDRTLMDPDQICGNDELNEPPVPLVSQNGVLQAAEGSALDALINVYR